MKNLIIFTMLTLLCACTGKPEYKVPNKVESYDEFKYDSEMNTDAEKEMLLSKLDTETRALVSIIDSINILTPAVILDLKERKINVIANNPRKWECNNNVYILSFIRNDVQRYNDESKTIKNIGSYTIKYGVLLEDIRSLVSGEISIKKGRFYVESYSLENKDVHYNYIYSYEEFIAELNRQIDFMKRRTFYIDDVNTSFDGSNVIESKNLIF